MNDNRKKTIVALSWRDIKAPKMGGAEVLSHAMIARLNPDKYKVIHISPMFSGAKQSEVIDGIQYERHGNLATVILYAFVYYVKHHREIDYVIDECNTHRFFTPLYVRRDKRVLFIHQLTREIWYIMSGFPLSSIGSRLETPMLKMYRKGKAITVSESTKQDLVDVGFAADHIYMMPNGINTEIKKEAQKNIKKDSDPTFIYVGRYASYKGIDICVDSFMRVKERIPNARLWLVGKTNIEYLKKLLGTYAANNKVAVYCPDMDEADREILKQTAGISFVKDEKSADIAAWGFVSEEQKYELMARAHLLLFPSIREGWGIIVTEAAILGTPSLITDAPGARDAVDRGKAGYVCKERDAQKFADRMYDIMSDSKQYEVIAQQAYAYSITHLWDSSEQRDAILKLEKEVFK